MKKNILAVIFVIVFSSIPAFTQNTIFVPTPPVINIYPQFDPVTMHLQQQYLRDSMNAASNGNGKKKRASTSNSRASNPAPVKRVKTATDFDVVGGRRILPDQLSKAQGKNASEISQAKQTFDTFLNNYEKIAITDGLPPNDLAYAFGFFIVNNYNIYKDHLQQDPADKAPMSPSADPLLKLTRMANKRAGFSLVSSAEKIIYQQMKDVLSKNPEIIKLTNRQKQEFTEMLAITTTATFEMYAAAGKSGDPEAFAEAQNMAKQSLEKLFGVSANKIKITANGLEF